MVFVVICIHMCRYSEVGNTCGDFDENVQSWALFISNVMRIMQSVKKHATGWWLARNKPRKCV